MPIYEYRRPDGTTFEVQQSFSDEPLTHDPDTGVAVTRVMHAPAVHFKGKGFYNTDYGTRKRQRETAAAAAAEKGSSSDGGGESKGDSAKGESTKGDSAKSDSGKGDSGKSDSGSSASTNGASPKAPAKAEKPVAAKD